MDVLVAQTFLSLAVTRPPFFTAKKGAKKLSLHLAASRVMPPITKCG